MQARPGAESASSSIAVVRSIFDLDATQWDAMVPPGDPFTEFGFLAALEESGVIGEGTPWEPHFVVLHHGDRYAAAMPLFIKWDSNGEFIFDWQWAGAFERAGIPYYPKGVVAAPFTPATGGRVLLAPGQTLVDAGREVADGVAGQIAERGLSGCHVLFCSRAEQEMLAGLGYAPRLTHQFHWRNDGYETFEDYLDALRSKKRKHVRRERVSIADAGVSVRLFAGSDVDEAHIDAMWRFYLVNAQRPWGQAYLNRRTFVSLLERCRDRLVLVLAEYDGEWIAGTFSMRKGPNLYGRYWGALREVPNLHFECCYYRLIEFAIDEKLALFEAGAQGEHKFLRGFDACPTYSAHNIAHPGARGAIERFLEQERRQGEAMIGGYNRVSPLKKSRGGA